MNSLARHHIPHTHPLRKLCVLGATLALAPVAAAAAAPTRPSVKTAAANGITYQSANLNGTVGPGGSPTTYFFQYGLTTRYGSQSLPANLAGGGPAIGVRSPITGLVPVMKYHYRLVAVNAVGTALGADATFTTTVIPLSLAIGALPNPVVFGAPLSVVGTLSGTGAAGRQVVLQQNPSPFTAGFQNVGNPELTSPTGVFQFNLLSLSLTTQFRIVSVGPGQPVISAVAFEYVGLALTLHARSRSTHRGYHSVRFSGLVSPAEPGAAVSLQRLTGRHWSQVAASNAHGSTGGSSRWSKTLHLRHGGFYRVFVAPVEPAHVANTSQPTLVHVGSSF